MLATNGGVDTNSADDCPPTATSGAFVPISVAVLCGGSSRRMGSDKALLSLRPGTPPMLALVINRVRGLSDNLFLVGVNRAGYDCFGVSMVEDQYPGTGPLGAIATTLATSAHAHTLIVACDMPFLSYDLLRRMAAMPRDQYDALVPILPGGTDDVSPRLVHQPLHAIYSRRCLPAIERCLQAGERRATAFYADVRLTTLTQQQIGTDEPSLRSFFSADTPAAVRQARAWLSD